MISIRRYIQADLEALYTICLATGDHGRDASTIYEDPELIGHIYAGPYGVLQPDLAFVAQDGDGVVGYALGVTDTPAWDDLLERAWWPALRARYSDPSAVPETDRTADQRLAAMIHHPQPAPMAVTRPFPAHLHIDLLPRGQGKGVGTALFDAWARLAMERGAQCAHIGANPYNDRAVRFWGKLGFSELALDSAEASRTVWMGRAL